MCITLLRSITTFCGTDNIMWNILAFMLNMGNIVQNNVNPRITLLWLWIMSCDGGCDIDGMDNKIAIGDKVYDLKWMLLSLHHFFGRIWNTRLLWDEWGIQIVLIAICLVIYKVHITFFVVVKVKTLSLSKWSYKLPPSCWLLNM